MTSEWPFFKNRSIKRRNIFDPVWVLRIDAAALWMTIRKCYTTANIKRVYILADLCSHSLCVTPEMSASQVLEWENLRNIRNFFVFYLHSFHFGIEELKDISKFILLFTQNVKCHLGKEQLLSCCCKNFYHSKCFWGIISLRYHKQNAIPEHISYVWWHLGIVPSYYKSDIIHVEWHFISGSLSPVSLKGNDKHAYSYISNQSKKSIIIYQ